MLTVYEVYQLVLNFESFNNSEITNNLEQLNLDFGTFSSVVEQSYQQTETFLENLRL